MNSKINAALNASLDSNHIPSHSIQTPRRGCLPNVPLNTPTFEQQMQIKKRMEIKQQQINNFNANLKNNNGNNVNGNHTNNNNHNLPNITNHNNKNENMNGNNNHNHNKQNKTVNVPPKSQAMDEDSSSDV